VGDTFPSANRASRRRVMRLTPLIGAWTGMKALSARTAMRRIAGSSNGTCQSGDAVGFASS
jgi:hypothetical protein